MEDRNAQRKRPKQVAPERIARMFERLRDGVPDFVFGEESVPFHSSYDNWHVLGKRRKAKSALPTTPKSPAPPSTSATSVSTSSRPGSLNATSEYDAESTTTSERESEQWVIARVSKHVLRLQREYKQALSLRKLSDADNIHFVKPLAFYRLPAHRSSDKPIAVSVVEAPGVNYLLDIVEFGPNFYSAATPTPLEDTRSKQIPLLTFLDFAIGASECCEILHHGHEMVHGELRGDAFHYDKESNTVRLINFGSGARSFEHGLTSAGWSSLTSERGVEHKLQFIAPEQTGRLPAEPDSRTDIYSLGILFWTMLTGRPAFAGTTPLEIMQNVLSRRMPSASSLRPDVPEELSAVLQKMTHKSIEDRYNSASGVKHDLQVLKKILTDGDSAALSTFAVAEADPSCFFKLPSHLVGREEQKQTVIDVIERAARRFARAQPMHKRGLMPSTGLTSGTGTLTSSDRLESIFMDDFVSDTTSSNGGGNRDSRLNSIAEITTPVLGMGYGSSSSENVGVRAGSPATGSSGNGVGGVAKHHSSTESALSEVESMDFARGGVSSRGT